MKVRIENLWHRHSIGIWLYEHRNNVTYIAEPTELVFKTHDPSTINPNPTFIVSNNYANSLLDSLANGLAEFGISKSNEKIQGNYESQSKHLEHLIKLIDQGRIK